MINLLVVKEDVKDGNIFKYHNMHSGSLNSNNSIGQFGPI